MVLRDGCGVVVGSITSTTSSPVLRIEELIIAHTVPKDVPRPDPVTT
jgi:hypothetical protein